MSSSRTISANGIDMFVREAGQGPLVVLCHGWPELSYSWRHQITALAAAGFRVVAPDMRGFGRTSAPADVGAYTIFDTVGDMVALVAALGEKQAMVVGHDWGAPVAWHAALFRPDIFTKVAGLSVPPPFRGRGRPLRNPARQRHHQLLLAVFPAAGRRRGRVRARHRPHHAAGAGARRLRSELDVRRRGQGLPRQAVRRNAAAGLADRGRHRRIRRGLPAVRLPWRPELVSQPRPQLGAHRAPGRTPRSISPRCSSPARTIR